MQVFDGNGKYQTQWNNLMRPCGLFVTRGKNPLAVIGELGPETVATLTSGVPNLGPRVSLVSARGEVLAHLGTRPLGEEPGQFIAPHGIAVDSRGDIYVAESPTPIGRNCSAKSRIMSCGPCRNWRGSAEPCRLPGRAFRPAIFWRTVENRACSCFVAELCELWRHPMRRKN